MFDCTLLIHDIPQHRVCMYIATKKTIYLFPLQNLAHYALHMHSQLMPMQSDQTDQTDQTMRLMIKFTFDFAEKSFHKIGSLPKFGSLCSSRVEQVLKSASCEGNCLKMVQIQQIDGYMQQIDLYIPQI